jgi:cell pole-organizing protein PopZ
MSDTSKPAGTAESTDPSMEDILASIRRILNEDEAPAAAEGAAEAAPVDDDVLVLDPSMMIQGEMVQNEMGPAGDPRPAVEAEADAPEPEPVIVGAESPRPVIEMATVHAPLAPAPEPLAIEGPPVPSSGLVAPETAAAAASSVGSLMRTLAAGRATQVYSGGPTLEDIVRAELRPLLKDWLDTNLPPLVERLVRAEIERVVGRAVP